MPESTIQPQRFRQLPVEITAIQFTPDAYEALAAWLPAGNFMFIVSPLRLSLHIDTLVAHPGDWIIRDVAGDFSICRDGKFQQIAAPLPTENSTEGNV
ncbi:hypothetical protein AB0E01_22795 [Nocardia vinacea]|uniref:hypothetical protein n=1 Tax=Nocardia vinacea TaxID=96468 RepID=UPI0033F08A9F